MHDKQSKKCDICVESKITKKTYHFVECQIEILGLIHIDLADKKQTMYKDGKNYFVTYDYSIYTSILNQR